MEGKIDRREFIATSGVGLGAAAFGAGGAGLMPPAEAAPKKRAYRAFRDKSYWNRRIPKDAPRHKHSDRFIDDFLTNSGTRHLQFTISEYSTPIFWPRAGTPEHTVEVEGRRYKIRIPEGASPASGTDSQLVIIDWGRNKTHQLHRASFSNGRWRADGASVYRLDSNGLDHAGRHETAPGWTRRTRAMCDAKRNEGHRGIPPPVMAVRFDEISAGAILHKLEMFIWASHPSHYFPMVGHEERNGIVPEGALLRIKPSVNLASKNLRPAALIIAKAIKGYGLVVGDNSGAGNRLKLERSSRWHGVLGEEDLKSLDWTDYEFIEAGYSG